jgi:HEAT repeat protein
MDPKLRPLVAALDSTDDAEIVQALQQIGDLGKAAVPALPRLLDQFLCADDYVRLETIHAIVRIDPERGTIFVSYLCEELTSGSLVHRSLAAEILGEIGADAKVAVPLLKLGTSDDCAAVACSAAAALGRITGDFSEAGVVIHRLLDHPDWTLRMSGIELLTQLGPIVPNAVEMVGKAIEDRNENVRRAGIAIFMAELIAVLPNELEHQR